MPAIGGTAENIYSRRVFRFLTVVSTGRRNTLS
jgi:hypothetical protein